MDKVFLKTLSTNTDNGSNTDTAGIIDSDFICDSRMIPLLTMGRTFVLHLLQSKERQGKANEVKGIIDHLSLTEDSLTRRLYSSCCSELGFEEQQPENDQDDKSPVQRSPNRRSPNYVQTKNYDEDKLSELIFCC